MKIAISSLATLLVFVKSEQTPMHYAMDDGGNLRLINVLLAAGADPEFGLTPTPYLPFPEWRNCHA